MDIRFFHRLGAVLVILIPMQLNAETLSQAVRAALSFNPSIEGAVHEAMASQYELLELQREYRPVVSLTARAGANRLDDPASLSPSENDQTRFAREIGVEAELVLFDGYRRANLVYSNAARVDSSIYRLLDAAETMALNATEVYIDVYRHLVLQEAASRNLVVHRKISSRVRELVEGGRLPVSDQLQIDGRTHAAELALIEVRRAGRDAEARYERIIGHPRVGPLSVASAGNLPKNITALITSAVENSYRVRVGNIEIERSQYQQKIVESDRKPKVTLNYGLRHGSDIDGARGSQSDAFIGVRMRWILGQGGRQAQTLALVERQSKAISERNVSIREVREMAEKTWNSYLSNADQVKVLSRQLRTGQDLVSQFNSEFEAGTRTLLDLLDAERSRFDIEFEVISANASLAFSTYRLLAAQSKLAAHFGIDPRGETLVPNYQARALVKPVNVFNTKIRPLE